MCHRHAVFAFLALSAPAPFLAAQALTPVLIPGPLSTREDELNATFTPDGRELYYTRKLGERFGVILVSRRAPDRWSDGEVAPFSGQYPDYDPFVTPDGRRIYWISTRPVNGEPRSDYEIWFAERRDDGWGPATHLEGPVNSSAGEYHPTVAADGSMYFSSTRPGGSGRGDLYRSRPEGAGYGPPERLDDAINTAAFEGDPFIAADGSYLVFTAYGRTGDGNDGDLYVSLRQGAGWAAPRKLGHGINSAAQEYAPVGSRDGKWLFFASYRGAIDEPRAQPLTTAELRAIEAGALNGHGNVYRVLIGAVVGE